MKVDIELSGGLELLFDNVKDFKEVEIPADKEGTLTMRQLIPWVRDNLLQERPELFVSGESIRPGILCLINDSDWEVEGTLDYVVQPGDQISFISTLHGG